METVDHIILDCPRAKKRDIVVCNQVKNKTLLENNSSLYLFNRKGTVLTNPTNGTGVHNNLSVDGLETFSQTP